MRVGKRLAGLGIVMFGLIAGVPAPAPGQWPRHRLDGLFPPAGAPGSAVEVTLTGEEVETGESLWFDHPGLSAQPIEKNRLRVQIGPDVPAGRHDVRLVGPLGISNPRSFLVDPRPTSVEAEPNNSREQALSLAPGTLALGQVNGAADVDWYKLDATAGQRLVVGLEAASLESRLDPLLRLFDPAGRELALSPDPDGDGADRDPLIDYTADQAGPYYLQVTDRSYSGSPNHIYALALASEPRVEAVMPLAVEAASEARLTLWGRQLPGPGRPALEHLEVTSRVPESLAMIGLAPGDALVPPGQAGQAGWAFRHDGPTGQSRPILLTEARGTVLVENEGDADLPPVAVPLPCDVSATFGRPGDVDTFRFEAKQGDVWVIEALAEGLGSPVDPSFRIQKVEPGDKPPTDLGGGEDTPDPGLGPVFSLASVDAFLRWQVPADGTYQVVATDLYGSHRGSPRLFYRLVIRPERPDFRLFIAPSDPTRPEGSTVRAGGRVVVRALVARTDGFDLPIEVEAVDLPPGLIGEPTILGPGVSQGPVVLRAAPELAAGIYPLQFIARAIARDRRDLLASGGTAPSPAAGTERPGIPGALAWTPAANQPGESRVTSGFPLAVRPAAPFDLEASPPQIIAAPGKEFELTVALKRNPGFDEAITLTGDFLPAGLAVPDTTIAKDQTSATIKVTVPGNLAPGTYPFLLRGTGSYPFQKNPKEEKKDAIKAIEPSNPLRLTVRKP